MNVLFVMRLPVLCEPEVGSVPDHAPVAVHDDALLDVQLTVEAPPDVTEAGLADNVRLGAGVGGGGADPGECL